MNWTEKHIKGLLFQKRIRGYQAPEKNAAGKRLPGKKSKALIWLEWNLSYWCNSHALTLEKEYKFSPDRNYLADFAIPALMLLLEFEGGLFMENGGHNSVSGIHRDIEKYALAEKLGYTVIRLTPLNYTTVLKTLNEKIA